MSEQIVTVQRVLASLNDNGYPVTDQRRLLVEHIMSRDRRFRAEELLRDLRASGVKVGRATVFRTLELMNRLDYLNRVPDGDHSAYAVCDPGHHHHLVCSSCGHVLHFADCPLDDLIGRLEGETGFRVEGHRLEIDGICPECRASVRLADA